MPSRKVGFHIVVGEDPNVHLMYFLTWHDPVIPIKMDYNGLLVTL